MNKISKIELGYFCGLVDGEGAVGICRNNSNTGHLLRKHKRYIPRVRINMTHKETIEMLPKILGIGRITIAHHGYGNRKPSYTFEINKINQLLEILPLIISHLITKKKQSELVLEFCKSRLKNTHITYYNKKMKRIFPRRRPYNIREKEIVNELYLLNQRGTNKNRFIKSGNFNK